jgi:hypothetical protein
VRGIVEMLNDVDLEPKLEPKSRFDLDRRFKRCTLECLYIWLMGEKANADHRRAVAKNILGLLGEIEASDMARYEESFNQNLGGL